MIHFIAKKIKNLCIKVNYRWKSFHERRKLQYIDFSIISNNCWAGFVYSIPENLENRVSLASYDYNLSINGPMHFNYTCDISKWKSGNYVIHISYGITIVKRIITIN